MDLGVVDGVVKEPAGGAHRDFSAAAANLKKAIINSISGLRSLSTEELVEKRYDKFRKMGAFIEG